METISCVLASMFVILLGTFIIRRKNSIENFLPPMRVAVDRVAAPNKDFADKGKFWSVPGTFQPTVTPRSASVQYGAQLVNNLPSEDVMAFRKETAFANKGVSIGNDDFMQPVTFDRFMFANKKSRRRTGGDPIRGDLPIIPQNTGWFRPSVQPHLDLQEGALNVLGGFDSETNVNLAYLMAASAGNSMTSFGGAPFSGEDRSHENLGAYMRRNVTKGGGDSESAIEKKMSRLPQIQSIANAAKLGNTIDSGGGMTGNYVTFNSPDGTVFVGRG